MKSPPLAFFLFLALPISAESTPRFLDATEAAGLVEESIAALQFIDLDGDTWPDVVMVPDAREPMAPRVFLHRGAEAVEGEPLYDLLEASASGLPPLSRGDILVFADLDNDGVKDAIVGRYLDIYQDDYTPPEHAPTRNGWLPGRGDGTFGAPMLFAEAPLATTRAVSIGDVNFDGLPDLFFGNFYERYFTGYEAFANDLLLQYRDEANVLQFVRWPLPAETLVTSYDEDAGGRPTYGVALPRLDDGLPMLLELNYGRRWNRLYEMRIRPPLRIPPGSDPYPPLELQDPRARGAHLVRQLQGVDIAPAAGVDGDAIRHGRHPRWPRPHADARPRSTRPDEPPFRANGNTFDVAVGDIDNDGDFDLFLSTIIHAWAGESSDRSRFLVNQLQETGELEFLSFEHLSVDRIPALPPPGDDLSPEHTQYNQGDIFVELADLNHDGRLDLILCSSQYPDPPPHDERLRIYFQQEDGRFRDVTAQLGIDHLGAGMPSLADVDGDGDLDLLVSQSFNRFTAEQRRAAALQTGALAPDAPADARPQTRVRLFRNEATEGRASLLLQLVGDPAQGVSKDAYGAIVRVTADLDGDPATPPVTQSRQVLGPAGHAGKQGMLEIHLGLGEATQADVEIHWPGPDEATTRLTSLPAGQYRIEQGSDQPAPLRPR
ncbi:MAG: FG-GAP repeat domain-containing protein [Opitutales bacterium]